MSTTDVLIVGAGPTGLALAIWLTKQNVNVRIIDKAAKVATTSRALAVQARILELYSQIGLGEVIADRAGKMTGPNVWVNGKRRAYMTFADAAVGLTAFPFVASFPQDEHEQLLISRLSELGVSVERATSLESFEDDKENGCVHAVIRREDGATERCDVKYIAGCDGAHSAVRHGTGTAFPGGTYEQLFYVADIEATGPAMNGELHLCLTTSDFLGVFATAQKGRARLIGIVSPENHPEPASTPRELTFDDVRGRAVDQMHLGDIKVNWFATYRSHHRVADHFRHGRTFLLGDAAHIHSPAGGQGMNTGIGDAINLAWKLASVIHNKAPDSLLDTYEEERIRFARQLVKTTDQAFTFMTKRGVVTSFFRSVFINMVLPIAFSFKAIRRRSFRVLAQFVLNYTGLSLSNEATSAGSVLTGERLPWVELNGNNNYGSLTSIEWQLHVYGSASEDLATWCKANGLKLTVFAWAAEYGTAGIAKNAVYLLRPDTYVAMIDSTASPKNIEKYFADRQLALGSI